MITNELLSYAKVSWEENLEIIKLDYPAPAGDTFKSYMTVNITADLAEVFPDEMEDIRVKVFSKVGNNYEHVWKMNLEQVKVMNII